MTADVPPGLPFPPFYLLWSFWIKPDSGILVLGQVSRMRLLLRLCLSCLITTAVLVVVSQLLAAGERPASIEPLGACQSPVVVGVLSEVTHVEARQAIRRTWVTRLSQANATYLFVLGSPGGVLDSELTWATLLSEHRHYNDLLVCNFQQSYLNLTLSTQCLLRHIISHCANAEFVLKMDDDVYLNPTGLARVVNAQKCCSEKPHEVIGHVIRNAEPVRERTNKWYASWASYSYQRYPDYASGTAYLMSVALCRLLLEQSEQISDRSKFHLEDVYFTGLLRQHVGARLQDNSGFLFQKRRYHPCLVPDLVSMHILHFRQLYHLDQKMHCNL